MNDFYVYEWIRLDTNEPFYVGKGIRNRALIPYRNRYFNNVIKKVGMENVAVSILHKNIDEQTALEYEVYYIALYKDEFGFNLTNLTDGGEGIAGYKWTDEQKLNLGKKMSEIMKNSEIRKKLPILVKRMVCRVNIIRKNLREKMQNRIEQNYLVKIIRCMVENKRKKQDKKFLLPLKVNLREKRIQCMEEQTQDLLLYIKMENLLENIYQHINSLKNLEQYHQEML